MDARRRRKRRRQQPAQTPFAALAVSGDDEDDDNDEQEEEEEARAGEEEAEEEAEEGQAKVIVPEEWMECMGQMKLPAIIALAASSLAQKLLFLRYFFTKANKGKVVFLDVGLGEHCEFNCPGVVALHVLEAGSLRELDQDQRLLFFLRQNTHKCYFVGEDTPKNHPQRYLEVVRLLISEFKSNKLLNEFSLVVNTSEWISGLGKDLLAAVLVALEPHHVIQFVPETKAHLQSFLPNLPESCQVHTLRPSTIPSLVAMHSLPSKDLRFECFASYLLSDNKLETGNKKTTAARLVTQILSNEIASYDISFDQMNIIPLGGKSTFDFFGEDDILRSISGTIVGIGKSSDDSPLFPPLIGFALVRAVNLKQRYIVLHTPIANFTEGGHVTIFVGNLGFPLESLYNQYFQAPLLVEFCGASQSNQTQLPFLTPRNMFL